MILMHPAVWLQWICSEIGGRTPLGELGPSNTMWPGPRPTTMRSLILIHLTVWPQCTNVTDRTGQTDNGPIAYSDRFFAPKLASLQPGLTATESYL